jgi:predicted metal-dependent hydrolase
MDNHSLVELIIETGILDAKLNEKRKRSKNAVAEGIINNVHLSVHPPEGHVTLSAPVDTRLEVARAYAITRLSWIREQQEKLRNQAREIPREFIERESHYLWGHRHLLTVIERDTKPSVTVGHKRITLSVRSGSDHSKRASVIHEWHKSLLHEFIPALISKWEPKLCVRVRAYFLQRMKTKWGSYNHEVGLIRLTTELVKKPKDLIEYVVVHEMLHLAEPTHSDRFISLLTDHFPTCREARAELNDLPLANTNSSSFSPSSALPTTSISLWPFKILIKPSRTTAWSSAIKTLIGSMEFLPKEIAC